MWTKSGPEVAIGEVQDIARDINDDIYVGGTRYSGDIEGGWVSKYNQSGAQLWTIDAPGSDCGTACAQLTKVLVASASYLDSIVAAVGVDTDGDITNISFDTWMAERNPDNGLPIHSETYAGATDWTVPLDVEFAYDGGYRVLGTDDRHLFLRRYDTYNKLQWHLDDLLGLDSKAAVSAGFLDGSLIVAIPGGGKLTLLRLDPDGRVVWSNTWNGVVTSAAITIVPGGDVVVAGCLSGNVLWMGGFVP